MTAGVYGIVAAIVKLDDVGLYLSHRTGAALPAFGRVLLHAAPKLMRLLSVVGTAAMFTVGGGILLHGLPAAHALTEHVAQTVATVAAVGALLAWLAPIVLEALAGIAAGALALGAVGIAQRVWRALKRAS